MKAILYLLLVTCLFSFSQKKNNFSIEYDTIAEKNMPDVLDFETHQLYIDTTSNSRPHVFFKKKLNSISYTPQSWTVIRKLEDNFIFYSRSDGMDPYFEIHNNIFVFHGVHEETKHQIKNIITTNKKIVITITENDSILNTIEIRKTKYPNISKIHFHGENYNFKYWVIKLKDAKYFNCLVNTYKYGRVKEYDKFIEPN
jgi:hypothetical protein